MARTINAKAVKITARAKYREGDIAKVERGLEGNNFFPIKAEVGAWGKPKAVGLFTDESTSSNEYKFALESLQSVISDYMFNNPDESITDIEAGLKMFISHKMDRAGLSAKEASGMTTYVVGKNKFLDHLARWNSKCFNAQDQSIKKNPRVALNSVFARNPNVQKQILAECMSSILMIKSFIKDNQTTIENAKITKEVKKENEVVLPANLDNSLEREVPKNDTKAPEIKGNAEERAEFIITPRIVQTLKTQFTKHAAEQRNKIVNIVRQNKFAEFESTRGISPTTSPTITPEHERLSESQKSFKRLEAFKFNQEEKSKDNKLILKQSEELKQNKSSSKTKTIPKPPVAIRTSILKPGTTQYPETYPVTSRVDFRLDLQGVNSPMTVFAADHKLIDHTIRGDLQEKLINQYTSIEQHKENIKKAEDIRLQGTLEQKIALAKKWQEEYLSIVRALKRCSDDELSNLVQNFAEYSDDECTDFAIDKYIKTQQIVAIKTIENVKTKIKTDIVEQPRLNNMERMMSETTRYHHMLALAICVRATYLELSGKTNDQKEKIAYTEIADREISRIKRLASSPEEYATLYRGKEIEPKYKDNHDMLQMFNKNIELIQRAGAEQQLQSIYNKVVKDWISRGHTIPVNMIADYAQELKIPQKYVKEFITHSDNHYEFANLKTPGNGMNCGLYSLLMLAFAYYNPKSREILDKMMNTEGLKLKLRSEYIATFNEAIKGSKEEFDRHAVNIRPGGKTVQQVLHLVYNKFSKFDDKGQVAGNEWGEEHQENLPKPLKYNESKAPEIKERKEIKKYQQVLETIQELDEVEEGLL